MVTQVKMLHSLTFPCRSAHGTGRPTMVDAWLPEQANSTILLLARHTVFRQALAFVLQRELPEVVVRQASSRTEAQELLHAVDIAVIDLDLPDGDGVAALRDVCAAHPACAVLALSASGDAAHLFKAIGAGAAAALSLSVGTADILTTLRQLRAARAARTGMVSNTGGQPR